MQGVQIGNQQNPTGGFENYHGDLEVLNAVVEQTRKQLDSELFQNSTANKIILAYDNILDDRMPGQIIDVSTFAMTKGRTIILNKFMYDDSSYLAKQYAESEATGHFPKGTDHNSVIAHEAGHIIDKYTRGLRNKALSVIEELADRDGVDFVEYIRKNISIYATDLNLDMEYHELISELNSMLNTGKKYDII